MPYNMFGYRHFDSVEEMNKWKKDMNKVLSSNGNNKVSGLNDFFQHDNVLKNREERLLKQLYETSDSEQKRVLADILSKSINNNSFE